MPSHPTETVACDGCAQTFVRRKYYGVSYDNVFCSTLCKRVGSCEDCGESITYRYTKRCKPCRDRLYRTQKSKTLKIKKAEYYQKNKARKNASSHAWYSANTERAHAQSRKWAAAHPERRREIERKSESRPESILAKRERGRKARSANPEYYRIKLKAWRKAHPDSFTAQWLRRRARKLNAIGELTEKEWVAIKKRQGGKCFDCGKKMKLTVGHLVSLYRGGCNLAINIVGQCGPCNSSQGYKIHPLAVLSLFDCIDQPDGEVPLRDIA